MRPHGPLGVQTYLQPRTVQPNTFKVIRDIETYRPWKEPVGVNAMINNPPRAIKPPAPRVIKEPESYKLWTESYLRHKVTADNLDTLNTRIRINSDELRHQNELKTHELKLNRIRETARIIREIDPPRPQISLNSFMSVAERLKAFRLYDSKYFSTEDKRPELTKEMLVRIDEASIHYPSDELLAEIDGVQILRKDIETLTDRNWLNDEIVNGYMNLLVMRGGKGRFKKVYAFNTFFYPKIRDSGYASVKRWTRKVDLFCFDFVLVPVHLGNHWCLACIDFTKRTVSYYDSLGGRHNRCCDILLDYLCQESLDKKKQNFDDENWRIVDTYSESIPRQKNGYDCGVFACTYAEYLTRQAKLSFTQEHMPYFRKKMIYEIVTKQVLA